MLKMSLMASDKREEHNMILLMLLFFVGIPANSMDTRKNSLSDIIKSKKKYKSSLLIQKIVDDKKTTPSFSTPEPLAQIQVNNKTPKNEQTKPFNMVLTDLAKKLAEQEKIINAAKKNDYLTLKNTEQQLIRITRDENNNNLLQILLEAELKPNLCLIKLLVPLTTWTDINSDKKTVLDCLDPSLWKHKKCAPFIVGPIYEYVKRLPEFSQEDDLSHPIYSAHWQDKTPQEKIMKKYEIAKKYLDFIKT